MRSISDFHNDPSTYEKFTSLNSSCGATFHQFQVQNASTLPFCQYKRTQRIISMSNLFTGYINQTRNNQTIANQTKRSNDQTFLLNAKTTSVTNLSRPALAPPNVADTYSLSSTNNIPFQTQTNLYTMANPCQTFYQRHTASNIGPSATLISSSSFVDPRNPSVVVTQIHAVPFVPMNKSVETFDGLEPQYTLDECLHWSDAHMIFTMGEQLSIP